MEYVYLSCFLLGGTVMVLQFLLSLLGIGGDHQADGHDLHGGDSHDMAHGHDHHHEGGHDNYMAWFTGMLTLRTLVAAFTFFGLAGLAATRSELEPLFAVPIAIAAGVGAMFLVGFLMRSLSKLKATGTARIERAVGLTGTVYLKVPGRRAGAGKVHLNVQNRTMEYQAVTSNDELPTGARVVVVGVVGTDTVEVIPATATGSATHA